MNGLHRLPAFLLARALSVVPPTWVYSEPVVLQPGPESGKDIWTRSVFSYAPGGAGPGGGLNNFEGVVGGWGDFYHSLIEFNLQGMPSLVPGTGQHRGRRRPGTALVGRPAHCRPVGATSTSSAGGESAVQH